MVPKLRRERCGDEGSRRPPTVELQTGYGTLKYYRDSGNVVAECAMPGHVGNRCRQTRRVHVPGDPHSRSRCGRPLGNLMAWLIFVPTTYSRDAHVHMFKPSLAQRKHARRYLKNLSETNESARQFTVGGPDSVERPKLSDEDSEPGD